MSARLMLDTHALLWVLLSPERLPPATLDLVADTETALWVSAASAWEIGAKFRLGKLPGVQAVVHGYNGHLSRLRAEEPPMSSKHALAAGLLTWGHRDPFDRMIKAQCMTESLGLVTADRAMAALPGLQVVW